MKAEFNASGTITISPETETEAYALAVWGEKNVRWIETAAGQDNVQVVDASKLLVTSTIPKANAAKGFFSNYPDQANGRSGQIGGNGFEGPRKQSALRPIEGYENR